MTELSLHILDIASNSVKAKATKVIISIDIDTKADKLSISIEDNGCGMSNEMLSTVENPFTTSRTTRKVGMGIPLYKQSAEATGGNINIESEVGKGTTISANFVLSSIDRVPLGDIGSTMITLIGQDKNMRYILNYEFCGVKYEFDTEHIKAVLGEDLEDIMVLDYIKEMINENINSINGGKII